MTWNVWSLSARVVLLVFTVTFLLCSNIGCKLCFLHRRSLFPKMFFFQKNDNVVSNIPTLLWTSRFHQGDMCRFWLDSDSHYITIAAFSSTFAISCILGQLCIYIFCIKEKPFVMKMNYHIVLTKRRSYLGIFSWLKKKWTLKASCHIENLVFFFFFMW